MHSFISWQKEGTHFNLKQKGRKLASLLKDSTLTMQIPEVSTGIVDFSKKLLAQGNDDSACWKELVRYYGES